jgi:hypothetical protein
VDSETDEVDSGPEGVELHLDADVLSGVLVLCTMQYIIYTTRDRRGGFRDRRGGFRDR